MMPSKGNSGTSNTATKCSEGSNCKSELALLDMYSGCGGMSTGLCLGAKAGGLDLVTVVYYLNFHSTIHVIGYD